MAGSRRNFLMTTSWGLVGAAAVGNPGAADSWWPPRRWRTGVSRTPPTPFEFVTPYATPAGVSSFNYRN